jgi:hypothetical protein
MQWRNNLSLCTPAIPCIRAAVARIGNDAEPVICMNFAFQDSKQISAYCVAFAMQIRNNSVSLLRFKSLPVKLLLVQIYIYCMLVCNTQICGYILTCSAGSKHLILISVFHLQIIFKSCRVHGK